MRDDRTPRRASGFSIIELMITVTIIAILAMIAIPNLIAGKINANEAAAISVLRSISTAQAQFLKSGFSDEDADGAGEYGTFGEMTATVPVRGSAGAKTPTDLTASMSQFNPWGEVRKSGYIYRMYLPNASGLGVRESPGGGIGAGVLDPDLAEQRWVCYAYPENYAFTGLRTFCINELAEITNADDPRYTRFNNTVLRASSGYVTNVVDSITGKIAVGTVASDGNFWKVAR